MIKQWQKFMVNFSKNIKVLLYSASSHQGSHKAHQAGNNKMIRMSMSNYIVNVLVWRWNIDGIEVMYSVIMNISHPFTISSCSQMEYPIC